MAHLLSTRYDARTKEQQEYYFNTLINHLRLDCDVSVQAQVQRLERDGDNSVQGKCIIEPGVRPHVYVHPIARMHVTELLQGAE